MRVAALCTQVLSVVFAWNLVLTGRGSKVTGKIRNDLVPTMVNGAPTLWSVLPTKLCDAVLTAHNCNQDGSSGCLLHRSTSGRCRSGIRCCICRHAVFCGLHTFLMHQTLALERTSDAMWEALQAAVRSCSTDRLSREACVICRINSTAGMAASVRAAESSAGPDHDAGNYARASDGVASSGTLMLHRPAEPQGMRHLSY